MMKHFIVNIHFSRGGTKHRQVKMPKVEISKCMKH